MITHGYERDEQRRSASAAQWQEKHIVEDALEARRRVRLHPADSVILKITPSMYRQLVREARALGIVSAGSDDINKIVGFKVVCEGPDTGIDEPDPFTLSYDEAAELAHYQGKATLFDRTVRRLRLTQFWKGEQYAIDEAVRLCSLCKPA